MNRTFSIIIGIILLALGIVAGYFIPHTIPFVSSRVSIFTSSSSSFDLINPTVTSDLGKHFIINFTPLKQEVIAIAHKYPQDTYVYFDYLNNASWVGLREKDLFTAASTVKVPLATALMKAVEEGKLKLEDTYSLDELDLDAHFGDLYKVGADKQFNIEEIMKIMLQQSDNTAAAAITNILKKIGIEDPLASMYNFLGWQTSNPDLIPDMGTLPTYQDINLKTLANMFLTLYNATYISTEHSQQILQYLTESPFDDKIVAGVPKDIRVAHKIGIAGTNNTFSDCGIVYAPNRNYILCLGSSGASEKTAATFMSEISKAVYQYVINN